MKDSNDSQFNVFLNSFNNNASKLGFKSSIQKDYILKVLYFSKNHLTADEIMLEIKKKYNINVGISTIYNSIKFFSDMNLVHTLNIGDGTFRYEFNHKDHHDHIICTKCNSIIEFTDEILEDEQKRISLKNKFKLNNHFMIIFGICNNCQKNDSNS